MAVIRRRIQEPGRGDAPIGTKVETATTRPYQFGDAPITAGNSPFYVPPSTGTSSINFLTGTVPARNVVTTANTPTTASVPNSSYMDPTFQVDTSDFVIEAPNFGGTGTGTGGLTAQQKIDNALKATALRTSQFGTQQAAQDILNRLQTAGQIPESIATIIKNATSGQTGYVQDQFKNLMDLLKLQYGRAQETTTLGYDALKNYLAANAPTVYADAARAANLAAARGEYAAPAVSDIAQYLRGQGVSEAGAQPGLLAAQAAAQGGAANYENLLNTLAAQERQAQSSRLAEEQIARTLAGTNLSSILSQQQGALTSSQLQALAQIQAQEAAARLRAQEQATAREQALQDALNTLLGTGYTTATGETPIIPKAPVVTTPIQQLAALPITTNKALKKEVDTFVAKNPNATAAQIEKKFPRLAQNIK